MNLFYKSIKRKVITMGDLNQLEYLKNNQSLTNGPILEIGSKDYGNSFDYRALFPDDNYIGIDLMEGKRVDVVADISDDFNILASKLGDNSFKTIICFSALEHCKELFKVCSNIQNLLDDGGVLFVSVPFSWEYHKFPEDYWRFTPEGIKVLFPDLEFIDTHTMISTSKIGEMKNPDDEFYKLDMAPRDGIRKKRYGLLAGIIIKILKYFPFFKPIFNYVFLMPPVAVHMVGIKRASSLGLIKK